MHVHVSDKSHNISSIELFECSGMYGIMLVYEMVEPHILMQLPLLVLEKVPLSFEKVPFPSCVDIHFPNSLLWSILCTKLEVILVLAWLVL
jgi:hypothetical protein